MTPAMYMKSGRNRSKCKRTLSQPANDQADERKQPAAWPWLGPEEHRFTLLSSLLEDTLEGSRRRQQSDRSGAKHAAEHGRGLTDETLLDFASVTDFGVLTLTHGNVISICFQLRLGGSDPIRLSALRCPQALFSMPSKQEPDTSFPKHNFCLSGQRGFLGSHIGCRTQQIDSQITL